MAEQDGAKAEGAAVDTGAKQATVDVEKITAEITEKIQSQFKSEIAGLNRKISELDEEKKSLTEKLATKEQEGKTVEQRIADIERQREQDKRDAALREKRLQLTAEAAKLGIPEEIAQSIDKDLSLDDAVERLHKLSSHYEERLRADINKEISSTSYKPGAEGGESQSNGKANIEALKKLDFKTMGQMSDAELAALDGSAS